MLLFILIHIIGAIITIFIHFKNGIFEYAAKYGDGIRFANPFDVAYMDLILWEIQFVVFIFEFFEISFNNIIVKTYERKKD